MYPILLCINGLIIGFVSYLVLFNPDQLASAVNQRLTNLAIFTIFGMVFLTGLSAYSRYSKQMPGVAIGLLLLSWVLLLICCYIFLARQKWM